MKTHQPKGKDIKNEWYLLDAKGQILGRFSTEIAKLLMGKHKVNYAPHLDMGDFVVVINAQKIEVTGRKEEQKKYYGHSGYPGGFKEVSFKKLKKEKPEKIIELAVKRMLPDNRLRKKRLARLKVYPQVEHLHEKEFENGKK